MKIRTGFVSNSSSSSFIIKVPEKRNEPCPTCGHKAIDILEYMSHEGDYGDSREVECTSKKEVTARLKEYKEWMGEDDYNEMMAAIKQHMGDIAIVRCSNHDEATKEMLSEYIIYRFSD